MADLGDWIYNQKILAMNRSLLCQQNAGLAGLARRGASGKKV